MMDEPMDFGNKAMYAYDAYSNFDSSAMMLDPLVAGPMMSEWNDGTDLDFSNFINNPVGA